MYVGNYEKLKDFKDHCKKMDLMDVIMTPAYRDESASHPKDKVISKWVKDLCSESLPPESRDLVSQKMSTHVKIDTQDGGTMTLKIKLDQMFYLTTDMCRPFKTSWKLQNERLSICT